jgi:leucyl-tRNA synthetase
MATQVPFKSIEKRWARRWGEAGLHQTALDNAAQPFYNLMEFPYPSGEGLHVGHVMTYCGADAFGRLRRMQGYDVFQPMGFDAFGIHSENYALKLGIHPAELVPANIANMRRQMQRLGCQFDWSTEVDTTSPEYYRWTQWIFVQLFKAGLAYQAEAPVNWCPQDNTVLANEQVINGCCERCDTPIERRVMRQWFFRITDFADRLLDFSQVDFPEALINRQRTWIGRQEGITISFPVESSSESISVFTTRPDTIFGATYLALAPEHPLAARLAAAVDSGEVQDYITQASNRPERDRLVETAKTGVFSGTYAINPANDQRVPIWIADYVLPDYGSGAIMGVPAHDGRDFDFAQAHHLPIPTVVQSTYGEAVEGAYEGDGPLINSDRFDGLIGHEARQAISQWLSSNGAAQPTVSYRLRDWLISRQRYWGPPIPIIHCPKCGAVPVPEDQLPVLLPPTDNVRPTGTEASPLAAIESFVNTSCPKCGGQARRETDVSDNFLDSAWYFLRYTSTDSSDQPWDAERVKRWLPVDHYAGGPEHATMHHLYARFITMALHDLGHLPFDEPFARIRQHGMITKEGAKMSKSRGNVITPDDYIDRYGADVFRMYMLFLGPWQEGGDFSDDGITGLARFAARIYGWLQDTPADDDKASQETLEALSWRHRTIARVTQAIESLRFHVALAVLMEYLNWLRGQSGAIGPQSIRRAGQTLCLLLAPLAPHLAEELWQAIGGQFSVHEQAWPDYDPELLVGDTIEIPVQVDGKHIATLTVPQDAGPDELRASALAHTRVTHQLEGDEPERVVIVPGKIVNIVTQ